VIAAYRAYAKRDGKTRWADKTPEYITSLSELSELFPTARFVHLIRDGRDVALSYLDMKRTHRHAATCAYVWSREVGSAFRQGKRLGDRRYFELRYEDLLDEPERELRRLCEYVGLPFEEAMLEHNEHDLEKLPVRFRSMHSRLALPPTKGLRNWREEMSPSEVAEFEAIAGAELRSAGYELVYPSPGLRTQVLARWRMVGFAGRYLRDWSVRRIRAVTSKTRH
jgi:hypothetical protein